MPRLIVDGSNVMGSRPDGWWRDKAAARIRLTVEIDEDADALCGALLGDPRADVVVVHDGPAVEMQLLRVFARFAGHADDLIVELAGAGDVVVTSDRELGRRVEAEGATVVGSGRVVRLLRDAAG
ncbi:hypothetical protein AB0L40_05865 [Patulibacter sp. NPDC049589]|uniref:hypothetical protein n=1 Tax=Patulibacter sp. NPDC049589 TaxID=3154731 RepID=UPI00342F0B34